MHFAQDALGPNVDFPPEELPDIKACFPLMLALRATHSDLHITLRIRLCDALHDGIDYFHRQLLQSNRRTFERDFRYTSFQQLPPCGGRITVVGNGAEVQTVWRPAKQPVTSDVERPAFGGRGFSLDSNI